MAAGETDEQLAERLATEAGAILLDLRARGDLEGKALGKAGDEQANAMLCREIRAARPADALLSEEEKDNVARCGQSRVWIVDPLDGTREYGEGRDDWAVHVALAVDGVATVGAVALPGLGITLTSGAPAAQQPANEPLRQPDAPCGRSRFRSGETWRRACCNGLGRGQGDGGRARRGGYLSPHRRPV